MNKITLVGAAGVIGHSIANALHSGGREYRVVGRDGAQLDAAFGADKLAEISIWDPNDPDSVKEAVRGSDVLVYLVGVPYDHFELHPILMRQTLSGAVSEGVQSVLLIGTVYPYGMPQTNPVTEDHPRQPNTFKGRMRKEQEDVLLEAHAQGKIQGAILRLPDFYGPNVERSFLHGLFQAAARGETANMVGPIDPPHEFVFVPDVGPVVAELIQTPGAWGRAWNLAGAGAVTQRELANRTFALAETKPRLRVAGKNTLRFLGLFNPTMREMVEMHYLLTNPVIMDDAALRGLLGAIRKTSYEDGVRLSFEAARASVSRAA